MAFGPLLSSTTIAKQLNDITECPICTESFSDPRSLPCIHAYCLKCIEKYAGNKKPGDKMSCPVCRREFIVPDGGVSSLPKNFFIEKMLDTRRLSSIPSESRLCDICKGKENAKMRAATTYCVECQETYCNKCSGHHRQLKATCSHHLVRLGESSLSDIERLIPKASPTFCDKHADQKFSVYCCDCKMAICVICFIASHKQHDCSDISDVIGRLQQEMRADLGSLVAGIKKLREMSASVEKQKRVFAKRVAETENEIAKTSEELKALIERDKQTLLSELAAKKQRIGKQFETVRHEIAELISQTENLKKYGEELSSKGAASDIARQRSVIHDRVQELLKLDGVQRSREKIVAKGVSFAASSLMKTGNKNVVGELRIKDCQEEMRPTVPTCTLTHIMAGRGSRVTGVTSLGSQVFIVRERIPEIDVYDGNTFARQHSIPVSGLTHARGLGSCAVNNCLYVSCHRTDIVYRVELSNNYPTHWWSLEGSCPMGIHVNRSHNVLITCYDTCRIQEHTSRGSLVRVITIQSGGNNPWYAIPLRDGNFAVSFCRNLQVCAVDANGCIVRSCGGAATNDSARRQQLKCPTELLQLKNGCILAVDYGNGRIVKLSEALNFMCEVPLPVDGGVSQPLSLYSDESGGRLFVGEECRTGSPPTESNQRAMTGRVLVFDKISL